jgi:predicted acetyltransferase
MIVAQEHRRKGIGSYILACTKAFCHGRDVIPICSCEANNTGSKKAITRAGFVSKHRIVLASFGA